MKSLANLSGSKVCSLNPGACQRGRNVLLGSAGVCGEEEWVTIQNDVCVGGNQQQAISPVASRENQSYSIVTGAMGYGPY